MSPTIRKDAPSLEHFRSYLHVIARLRLKNETQGRIDPADMVQRTMLDASQQRDRFNGQTPGEMAVWLRRILAQNLGNAFRVRHRSEQDPWPDADPAPPSAEQQSAMCIAEALLHLPEPQREALVLQYWHGMTLAEIGARLETTPIVVAGLLKRALSHVRELLDRSG